jgi:hypothetical protein
LEYFTDHEPVWFAGPDIIASILLNDGQVPHIIRAIRVVPIGKQEGLKSVRLLGKVHINPAVDDFYKHVVEQKEAHKADATLKKGLKCIGNAGAYGPLVELNERNDAKDVKLDVYSGEHYHEQTIRKREAPGPFYFPPVASLITAGGRLLLALAQKCVEDAGGRILFCDTDSLCIVANEKGGLSRGGGAQADLGYAQSADMREFAPIPCLSRDTVLRISERFTSLNPYSFGGTILKVEDVNYQNSDPRKPFRELYGFAISAKRYAIFEGKYARKIVDAKAHGIGYLMNPLRNQSKGENQFAEEFWQLVLQNEGISFKNQEPEWLDYPAMMQIPVSSPAVLGRLKDFCKPRDFVLAPVIRDADLDSQAEKPILITRFTKHSDEWMDAIYHNVRKPETCRITTGKSKSKNVVPVRSYRSVLNAYVNNAESKFNGPDGKQCWIWTRGMLERMHVVAGEHRYCGKEFKRKLEQGPVDHEMDFKCKVYENGRVAADAEALRQLAGFSERQIRKGTGVRRDTIRLIRHGKAVKRSTYRRVVNFLKQSARPAAPTA